MLIPCQAFDGTFKVGDKISAKYLNNNCQLQAIFDVNCLNINGEISNV